MGIRVLIVDDSPIVCLLLSKYLQLDQDIEVVGVGHTGIEAIDLIEELQPDVVTLDLHMPEMDGITTLQHIMKNNPTSVIVITGASRRAADLTIKAINYGAIDFIFKYVPSVDTDPDFLQKEIVAKVKVAHKIKVIRSGSIGSQKGDGFRGWNDQSGHKNKSPQLSKIVVIGASSGGPIAVRDLLASLPAGFPAPIVVVQHMPASFTRVFAHQLDRQVSIPVREAQQGDFLRPGEVLVAPGDYHLIISKNGQIQLSRQARVLGNRPSINVTMDSAAQNYGRKAFGVLLTGMGEDGVSGLASIQANGGQTFAQNQESCLASGMPKRALKSGAVDFVSNPAGIAKLLGKSI